MFSVSFDDDMFNKIKNLLEDEDDGTGIRLKEYKVGSACKTKFVLGIGMDEPDEDEDETMIIDGVLFLAEKSFLERYGNSFRIYLNENKNVSLKVEN